MLHRKWCCNIFCLRQDAMYTTNQLIHGYTGKHKLYCPRADVALGLRLRDNIKPLCNITCVYQLPMYQLLLVPMQYFVFFIVHKTIILWVWTIVYGYRLCCCIWYSLDKCACMIFYGNRDGHSGATRNSFRSLAELGNPKPRTSPGPELRRTRHSRNAGLCRSFDRWSMEARR